MFRLGGKSGKARGKPVGKKSEGGGTLGSGVPPLRFAMIEDMSWEASITQGWQLLRHRTSKTIGVALSSFLTKVVFSIFLVFIGLILALPIILIGIASLGLALIPMIGFGVILLLFFTAYLGTFGSSVWTIGFMQLTEEETAPEMA